MTSNIPLRVFLCHASSENPAISGIRFREEWIDSWAEDLELADAVKTADVILVCLNKQSITSEGYIQKDIANAMDLIDEAERTIPVIIVRVEDCRIPGRLRKFQHVDYFSDRGSQQLTTVLREYYEDTERTEPLTWSVMNEKNPDLYKFIQIELQRKSSAPYTFWISKYPVTNAQYARFLGADDFGRDDFWQGFLKFDEHQKSKGRWGDQGLIFLRDAIRENPELSSDGARLEPRAWQNADFGVVNPNNPVVGISWFEANAYANWLLAHWHEVLEEEVNVELKPQILRLPLETEWNYAARGDKTTADYPWNDFLDTKFFDHEERLRKLTHRANIKESDNWHTTPVNTHPDGASLFGLMDMIGNVWEWQANTHFDPENQIDWVVSARGGGWNSQYFEASLSSEAAIHVASCSMDLGFRLVAIPIAE
jgi:formylglycine-generating enzyme required for sulfatase activity